ncbi:putative inorganic phosphate transporter 1-5 [Acorus gramineus]|uniref:Inorganic phosphate transporter 1-5 n=1 Tax=Acorus gramineus TaxID=55184 RepID=A0AAV9A064_ACOGR|nr:putative inorganic phosphate transporter 1-5 [Acorus gramineus]
MHPSSRHSLLHLVLPWKLGLRALHRWKPLRPLISQLQLALLRQVPEDCYGPPLLFKFWFGFCIGRDYPLSATIISEYANKKTRGAFIAAVFAMQGFSILAGGILLAIIMFASFNLHYKAQPYSVDRIGSTVPWADYVWRIILIFGALLAALTEVRGGDGDSSGVVACGRAGAAYGPPALLVWVQPCLL